MFQTKVLEKIKDTFSNVFLLKSCHFRDYVAKYSTARQVTDDDIIRCMHIP